MVEFSSPNTNKPLHLGHIRNILLGWSDFPDTGRRRAMRSSKCKWSTIAVLRSARACWPGSATVSGATPASTGVKGDHFVGAYYVRFEQEFQKGVRSLAAICMPASKRCSSFMADEKAVQKAEKALAEIRKKAKNEAERAREKCTHEECLYSRALFLSRIFTKIPTFNEHSELGQAANQCC